MQVKARTSVTYKALSVIILLSVFFSAFGTGNFSVVNAQEQQAVYENYYDGYTISYPSDWNINPSSSVGAATDISPAQLDELGADSIRINIIAFNNSDNLSVQNWHATFVADTLPISTWNVQGLSFFQYTEDVHDFLEFGLLQNMSVIYISNNKRIYRIIEFCDEGSCADVLNVVKSFKATSIEEDNLDSLSIPMTVDDMQMASEVNLLGQHLDQASPVALEAPWKNGDTYVLSGSYYNEGAHNDANNDYYASDWNKKNTSCDGDSGEQVMAAAIGKVVMARNYDPGLNTGGQVVRIQSTQNSNVTFAIYHLSNVSVSLNQDISSLPFEIGRVGKSGLTSTSCAHIHLSVRQTVNGTIYSIRPGDLSGQTVSDNVEITSHNGGSGGGSSACPGPSLSSPNDGYISTSQTINFNWSGLSGCTFSGYTFRINDSSNLDDSPIVDTGVGGTSRQETLGAQWNNRDLWWGVKAANSTNANWSVSRRFRIQPSNNLPSDYGLCAEEGQTCAFSGSAQIYYGAGNQFVGPVTKTDGVACSNDIFGDPISGTHKQCFIKGGRPQGSTFCANEGGTCSFGGSSVATVYFGANGKYSTHTGVVGSTACNVGTFGDPFSGIGKACYYIITGSSISSPSNPNPSDNTTFARTNNTVLSWSTNGTSCTIHIWGGNIDISPSNSCGSLTLGNQYGGSYNWQVTASNGGSATGPIWHFNIKPYAPTNLTMSGASASQVTLHWNLSSDDAANIDEYDIYQDGTYIGYVTKGMSTYTVTGLSCSNAYSFYVRSKRQGVLSDASNTVARGVIGCPPTVPSNFAVSNATNSSLTLNWQDNSNNESGFKIYRWQWDSTQNSNAFVYLDTVSANTTSYTQTGLDCGSDFNYYELSAYNANGESAHVGWVQGSTSPCPQPDLTITNISIWPASPFTNEDVFVSVDVTNLSSNDAPGFWTDFYLDDTPTGCADWGSYYGWVDGLAANETFTWYTRVSANTLGAGSHEFRAYVDSGCAAAESNESNNISSSSFSLTLPSSAAPTHDDFDAAKLISPIPYNHTVDVSGATTSVDDPYVPDCGGYVLTPGMTSVWYKYTPPTNTSLYLDTFGSTYDTYIAVWSGTRSNLSSIACNDDLSGHGLQSGLTVNLTAGTTYYIEVAQYSDSFLISSLSTLSTPENDLRSTSIGASAERYAPILKPDQEVDAQAGGTLQFHAVAKNIEVYIGGALQGSYLLGPGQSQKTAYALDNGPVKIASTNGFPLIAALREALLTNGSLSSFSQLMGLPNEQLSDTYWFPAYVNNSSLSGQLRFGNVGVEETTVTVTIGGNIQGSYLLQPNESKKIAYDLDMGPVKVQSSGGVPIVAALRDGLLVNGSLTTFSQLMGLPDEQLSDTYWFPAYVNNSTLSGQLRFGNVGGVDTTVTVTIGGVIQGSYLLHPNESRKVSYPLDLGPVKVQSTGGVPIVAALREALLVNGSLKTFSQLMGLPEESLSDAYYIPSYVNNSTLSGQLRFGNVGVADTTVTVTIGGVERGSYLLHPNESKKIAYALDQGPVIVESSGDVPIVAALRDSLLANGSLVTFSQLMGLPQEQLSSIYWIPAYVNNATLSGQLRFGVP